MKHILCYGDSNTWGFQPGFGGRYPRQRRWTGVAEGLLGDGYVLLENGLNGRTTDFDDPGAALSEWLKGFAYAMVSQKPIDLLILMLGTNDLKFTTAEGSRDGLASILEEALHPEIHFPSGSSPGLHRETAGPAALPHPDAAGTVFDRPCGGPKDSAGGVRALRAPLPGAGGGAGRGLPGRGGIRRTLPAERGPHGAGGPRGPGPGRGGEGPGYLCRGGVRDALRRDQELRHWPTAKASG